MSHQLDNAWEAGWLFLSPTLAHALLYRGYTITPTHAHARGRGMRRAFGVEPKEVFR
jgi:hypothetical protein